MLKKMQFDNNKKDDARALLDELKGVSKIYRKRGRSAGIFRVQKKSTPRDFLSQKNSAPRHFLEQNNSTPRDFFDHKKSQPRDLRCAKKYPPRCLLTGPVSDKFCQLPNYDEQTPHGRVEYSI